VHQQVLHSEGITKKKKTVHPIVFALKHSFLKCLRIKTLVKNEGWRRDGTTSFAKFLFVLNLNVTLNLFPYVISFSLYPQLKVIQESHKDNTPLNPHPLF
jgi:hypothetical protein